MNYIQLLYYIQLYIILNLSVCYKRSMSVEGVGRNPAPLKRKQGKAWSPCPLMRKWRPSELRLRFHQVDVRPLTALCMQLSWAAPFQGCVLEHFLRPFLLLGSRVVLFMVPRSLLASFHSCQGCSHVSTVGTQRVEKCVKRNVTGGKHVFSNWVHIVVDESPFQRVLSKSSFLVWVFLSLNCFSN